MTGIQYMDEKRNVYQVLPVVWLGGYRTFRRLGGRNWRPAKDLPWRTDQNTAASDLESYAEQKGWIRV